MASCTLAIILLNNRIHFELAATGRLYYAADTDQQRRKQELCCLKEQLERGKNKIVLLNIDHVLCILYSEAKIVYCH